MKKWFASEITDFAGKPIAKSQAVYVAAEADDVLAGASQALNNAKARIRELEQAIQRQGAAALAGMNAATAISSGQLRQAHRLRAESSPEMLESEREANAILTERIAALETLRAEVDRMRKLFWLAKEDVIFFSGYDPKSDSWPKIDLFYTPCINLPDTFGYACADGEQLDDSEIDRLITAHKTWGFDGVVAWASLIRKCEPIEPRRTDAYREARSALGKEVTP